MIPEKGSEPWGQLYSRGADRTKLNTRVSLGEDPTESLTVVAR